MLYKTSYLGQKQTNTIDTNLDQPEYMFLSQFAYRIISNISIKQKTKPSFCYFYVCDQDAKFDFVDTTPMAFFMPETV